ncbi:MAG: DNA gyrase subunit A [Desulfovibrio sp.]|jgi:DNA gyrase subunit A|nr:DNA gyrase subunit A [Desulfovibrio sp.]
MANTNQDGSRALPGGGGGATPLVDIEKELRKSYLEYSLSVIIGRAIPDVRDGLKPVHRRILFAQHDLGNTFNRPPKKSARVVGDVIGKYHPHGDSAVYDALVRMAQDFSMRDPLVDGQGNFGSIDGDSPAAMRYTEVRMARLAGEFLADIGKQTVDFRPNYDNTLEEPVVLPTKVPNFLLNGTSGIAVGMATNVPPHNLGELCGALLHLLDEPACAISELTEFVQGPDFPTGGIVYAGKGLDDAFRSGRGSVKVRGRVEIETRPKGGESIVIKEIPYALNKSSLVKKIAALVNEKRIDGVADLRDESDRKGIRIVLDLKRGAVAEILINSLYKYTPLESSFAYNMLAVVGNRPQLLDLKSALAYFLEHRREVVIRRTRFDLKESEAQAHILEGLSIALDNIEAVISLIRASKTPDEAREDLMQKFSLSDLQSRAILNMRLQRLTGLERDKLLADYRELIQNIAWLKSILENDEILRSVIRDEIKELKDTFASKRRSEIVREDPVGIEVEDLIPDEDVVITVSRRGYIKRTTLDNYHQQRRGGQGIAGLQMSDGDMVQDFLTTSNHQFLLLFTNRGRMHQLKVHQVPEGSRTAKGAHIANLLPLEKEESVTVALSVREFNAERYFLFVTRRGMIKRSDASLYARARKSGINAVGLREGDELIMVREVQENCQVVLTTAAGQAIRFACTEARPTGRGAAGVKGIALRGGDEVVACVIIFPDNEDISIMTIARNGYGKRTGLELYPAQSRGGRGVINLRTTNKTGPVIGAIPVADNNALLLLTSANKIIRIGMDEIRKIGRVTQGVRLVSLPEGASVVGFARIDDNGDDTEAEPGKEV